MLTAVAFALCILGIWRGGAHGLLAAILLVAVGGALVGRKLSRRNGAIFVSLLWLGFCLAWLIGDRGGWLGLLTITLPGLILFWLHLYRVSNYILPYRDGQQRWKGFRSLLTFNVGTNFPYHVVENRKLIQRVPGNPFRSFFAGPGIVLTGCDHVAVLSDGVKIRPIQEPGLVLMDRLDQVVQIVDLRTQLAAFDVEALTKDGIRIKVLTFVPFKIGVGDKVPELGKSFPFDQDSIVRAMYWQPLELERKKQEDRVTIERRKIQWHELVPFEATRILRDIISRYTFDKLCAPYEPGEDPRLKIKEELATQIKEKMRPLGIDVVGGGIANLEPTNSQVIARRIDNWRAEWARRVMVSRGKGEAEAQRLLGQAQAQAQAEIIRTLSRGFEAARAGGKDLTAEVIALRFLEAMEEMVHNPPLQEKVAEDVPERLRGLRHLIAGGQAGQVGG
jgi:regulator of protease activity HflC (stomatin/prohibitin superfamily)